MPKVESVIAGMKANSPEAFIAGSHHEQCASLAKVLPDIATLGDYLFGAFNRLYSRGE
jgi:hypothetical protein